MVVYLIEDEIAPLDKRYWMGGSGKPRWTRSKEFAHPYRTRRSAAAAIRRNGIALPTVTLLPVEVEDYGMPIGDRHGYPLHIIKVIE